MAEIEMTEAEYKECLLAVVHQEVKNIIKEIGYSIDELEWLSTKGEDQEIKGGLITKANSKKRAEFVRAIASGHKIVRKMLQKRARRMAKILNEMSQEKTGAEV